MKNLLNNLNRFSLRIPKPLIKVGYLTLSLLLFSHGYGVSSEKSHSEQESKVSMLVGRAFGIENDKTWTLRKGEKLKALTEIMTEESSQLSFTDFEHHQFHLSGSGHLKIDNRILQLKRGHLWIQSLDESERNYAVATANSWIVFKGKGEAIIFFDNSLGKTQILVLNGHFTLRNIALKDSTQAIPPGQFSFVDNQYNDGRPRMPTVIGQSSFKEIMALFPQVRPIEEERVEKLTSGSSEGDGEEVAHESHEPQGDAHHENGSGHEGPQNIHQEQVDHQKKLAHQTHQVHQVHPTSQKISATPKLDDELLKLHFQAPKSLTKTHVKMNQVKIFGLGLLTKKRGVTEDEERGGHRIRKRSFSQQRLHTKKADNYGASENSEETQRLIHELELIKNPES